MTVIEKDVFDSGDLAAGGGLKNPEQATGKKTKRKKKIAKVYGGIASLPPAVKNHLPVAAQKLWLVTWNKSYAGSCKGDETCAFKTAWYVVGKAGYKKGSDGTYTKSTVPPDELDGQGVRVMTTGEGVMVQTDDAKAYVTKVYGSLDHPASVPMTDYEDFWQIGDISIAKMDDGYAIRAQGRKIAWLETENAPKWIDDSDLIFGKSDDDRMIDPDLTMPDEIFTLEGVDEIAAPTLENASLTITEPTLDKEPELTAEQKGLFRAALRHIGRQKAPQIVSPTYNYSIVKSAPAKRYTFGPVYIPDVLDLHKEFVTADDLQESFWNYVRNSSSRTLYLQHSGQPAGEWVEIVSWPYPCTAMMAIPGQGITKAELPANTEFMGCIWYQYAWEQILAGARTGLSMAGTAKKRTVMVDLQSSGDLVNLSP